MKIAISADGPDTDSKIAARLGTAEYMLILDPETGEFEALPNMGGPPQRAAGVRTVMLAVGKDVKTLLTGYCSPAIREQFRAGGIEIIAGLSGTVAEAVERYKKDHSAPRRGLSAAPSPQTTGRYRESLIDAAERSVRQFFGMLPVLVCVIFLLGAFNVFLSRRFLAAVFSGNAALDTFLGACFGGIFAGNAINSYIIAGELLRHNVSLIPVTAFLIAWVTVGIVQLPAETAALGFKFAFLRNLFSFISAIIIAILTALILSCSGKIL